VSSASNTRPYESAQRAEAARETRRRILRVAESELLAVGYHATSVATLAKAAGVSPQTIYNSVGSKAQVVKAVYDVLLAGDDEQVAMSDRPEFRAVLNQRSIAATLRSYAGLTRLITSRVGAVVGVLIVEGAGGDTGLREFLTTVDRERRIGNEQVVKVIVERFGLPDGLPFDQATDQVWALTAPELADRLVRRRGWSLDDFEQWLAAALIGGFSSPRAAKRPDPSVP